MAKPQFILGLHERIINDLSINEGYTQNPMSFQEFVQKSVADLVIRQRDRLDGIGEKEFIAQNNLDGSLDYQTARQLIDSTKQTGYIFSIKIPPPGSYYSMDFAMIIKVDGGVSSFRSISDFEYMDIYGDSAVKQILPYTVFKCGNRFVTYRRTNLVGESRLAGNSSIGFGGHIDLGDVVVNADSSINLADTIYFARVREVTEEVKMSETLDGELSTRLSSAMFGLISDDSDQVGRLHLGVVAIVEINEDEITDVNEEELEFLGLKTPEEILELNPENWTRLIVEKFITP